MRINLNFIIKLIILLGLISLFTIFILSIIKFIYIPTPAKIVCFLLFFIILFSMYKSK